jgi:long-chain acyl-CoA synthetase
MIVSPLVLTRRPAGQGRRRLRPATAEAAPVHPAPPSQETIMPIETIPELFLNAVRNFPRPDCFSYRGPDRRYVDVSSEDAYRRVRALRQGIKSLGIKPGDRVALLSENRLEWALADLAILCSGAVTVPIYPTLLADAIGYIVRDCAPVAIFVSTAEQAEKIHELRSNLPSVRDVIAFDEAPLPNILPYAKLLQIGENMVADHPPEPRDEFAPVTKDDLASIIYTSGTTGDPKGVMLTHWNFVSNVLAVHEVVRITQADRCLSFLPLSHVLERTAGYYCMLYRGVGIAYAERMDTVPQDMLDVRPTVMISVPRLYEKIYARVMGTAMAGSALKKNIFFWARKVGFEHGRRRREGEAISLWLRFRHRLADRLVFRKLRARTGGRLRFFVSGGAPLAPAINEFFYAAGLTILEGYGLTETAPVLAANTFEHFRIGSVGPALPRTEIRIAQDGEIVVRGPQIMKGYYNNPEATQEVLSEDGWLATGDIGHLDKDGFLFITDRKKDIIVTAGGKNIAPQPIENAIRSNRYVSQVVVIGDQHPYLSCLIVPNFETLGEYATQQGISATEPADLIRDSAVRDLFDQQLAKVNNKLPGFNQVRTLALLPREFTIEAGELTPTLKVKRWAIAKKYASVIDTLYPVAEE